METDHSNHLVCSESWYLLVEYFWTLWYQTFRAFITNFYVLIWFMFCNAHESKHPCCLHLIINIIQLASIFIAVIPQHVSCSSSVISVRHSEWLSFCSGLVRYFGRFLSMCSLPGSFLPSESRVDACSRELLFSSSMMCTVQLHTMPTYCWSMEFKKLCRVDTQEMQKKTGITPRLSYYTIL